MSRDPARRRTSATAVRPTKRSQAVKMAERGPELPARTEGATPEQIARAVYCLAGGEGRVRSAVGQGIVAPP